MAQRYGAPSPWRRRTAVLLTVVLAAVAGLLVAWAAWSHATPEARSELVVADVQVQLSDRAADVQCVLRALAEDKSAVGEAVFTPESSGRLSVPIRTERRATAVEKVGCTAEGQQRPR